MRLTIPPGGRAALVALALTAGAPAQAEDNPALALLKSMSDYMAAQTTLKIGFDSDVEVVTPALEKIQFASSGEVLLQRPDKLRVHRTGGYSDAELVYDGKTATLTDLTAKTFAALPLAGTLDELRGATHEAGGMAVPGADLLVADPFALLSAGVVEAKHIGQGVIGGTTCEHLAFRNADVDWQLWVATGDAPRPCKMVVTSKTVVGAPQYTIQITSFEAGLTLPADAFAPMAGGTEVPLAALGALDEIPAPGAAE